MSDELYNDGTWRITRESAVLPDGRVKTAKRELREETGFRAEKIEHYFTANLSETYTGQNHFYLASGLVSDPLPQDDDEMIEVHELTLQDALNRVLNDPFLRMPSALPLLRYMREHPELA